MYFKVVYLNEKERKCFFNSRARVNHKKPFKANYEAFNKSFNFSKYSELKKSAL